MMFAMIQAHLVNATLKQEVTGAADLVNPTRAPREMSRITSGRLPVSLRQGHLLSRPAVQ